MTNFESIRDYYVDLWPKVKERETWVWANDPNEIQWDMSPIERIVWGFIRDEGLVLYPQHPCAGYFVDFGHPKARVAIECDGKMFHQDKERDAQRQRAIEAKGWTVYRLRGRDCTVTYHSEPDEEGELHEIANPALALVRQIGRDYRLSSRLMRQAA